MNEHYDLDWHCPLLQRWEKLWQKKIFPQVALIYGAEGIGKKELTIQCAKKICCTAHNHGYVSEDCHCQSCLWFEAGTHPLFFMIDEVKNVQTIRDCLYNIQYQHTAVVCIYTMESLSPEAGDMLLKSMEELRENIYFLLVSHRLSQVADTLKSRACFFFVPNPDPQQYLLNNPKERSQEMDYCLSITHYAPKKALALYQNFEQFQILDRIIQQAFKGKAVMDTYTINKLLWHLPIKDVILWIQVQLCQQAQSNAYDRGFLIDCYQFFHNMMKDLIQSSPRYIHMTYALLAFLQKLSKNMYNKI